jgi:hypothetical protein
VLEADGNPLPVDFDAIINGPEFMEDRDGHDDGGSVYP